MAWKLIATAQPAGSNTCIFSSIPRGYKRLRIIGAFSPSASGSSLTFGSGNSSDYHYGSFVGINASAAFASSRVPYGNVSAAYGNITCYFTDWDSTNNATDMSALRVEIDNYDVSGANARIPFTIMKVFPYADNKYGTLEYTGGTNQNQSGTAFTNIHLTTGNVSSTFQTGSKFSLYGLE